MQIGQHENNQHRIFHNARDFSAFKNDTETSDERIGRCCNCLEDASTKIQQNFRFEYRLKIKFSKLKIDRIAHEISKLDLKSLHK